MRVRRDNTRRRKGGGKHRTRENELLLASSILTVLFGAVVGVAPALVATFHKAQHSTAASEPNNSVDLSFEPTANADRVRL